MLDDNEAKIKEGGGGILAYSIREKGYKDKNQGGGVKSYWYRVLRQKSTCKGERGDSINDYKDRKSRGVIYEKIEGDNHLFYFLSLSV